MAPRVAILSERENFAVQELKAALSRHGITPVVLPASGLAAGIGAGAAVSAAGVPLDAFDLVLIRQVPGGTLEQVVFRMDALHRLARLGVRVVNPPLAIERMVDKYTTSTLLAENSIPTPRTAATQTYEQAMEAFQLFGEDVVAKPLFGSEGRGIVRLSDPDTAYRVFRAWEQIGAVYYLQEFVDHGVTDIRAFVVGDRVVAAMERVGDSWKTNVSNGARAVARAVPPDWERLAVRAARAVGAIYAGVDMLPARDGSVLIHEVNAMPGWSGLQQTTDLRIGEAVVDHCLNLVCSRAGIY